MVVLHCGDAQNGGRWWEGTMSCHGNHVGTWGDWEDKMESTEERGAEEEGCRLAEKGVYWWWTCSGQPWSSDPKREGSWAGPEVQAS